MAVMITGVGGLVGSACARYFADRHYPIIGIDADVRGKLFGPEGSVRENIEWLQKYTKRFHYEELDLRYQDGIERVFRKWASDIQAVIHCAGQPSHEYSARYPLKDFDLNANATMHLLETARRNTPRAAFIFVSTNKVYGDSVNFLPFEERQTRWDLPEFHLLFNGIHEDSSLDACMHSPFGVSKAAADLMVQEYGYYYGMNTAVFRCGCITGVSHRGVKLHGFLAYLAKCIKEERTYEVYGYGGKQVRDNIHAEDLAAAFYQYFLSPRPACVYNMGGGRANSCSIIEAAMAMDGEQYLSFGHPARVGDHQWWITDTSKFERHYPLWSRKWPIADILEELLDVET